MPSNDWQGCSMSCVLHMVTESHLACLREVPAFVPLDTVERWAEFVVRYLSLFLRNIIASEVSSVFFLAEFDYNFTCAVKRVCLHGIAE